MPSHTQEERKKRKGRKRKRGKKRRRERKEREGRKGRRERKRRKGREGQYHACTSRGRRGALPKGYAMTGGLPSWPVLSCTCSTSSCCSSASMISSKSRFRSCRCALYIADSWMPLGCFFTVASTSSLLR